MSPGLKVSLDALAALSRVFKSLFWECSNFLSVKRRMVEVSFGATACLISGATGKRRGVRSQFGAMPPCEQGDQDWQGVRSLLMFVRRQASVLEV